MVDRSLGRVFSFSFISISLYLGISIGVIIRLGQSQRLNAATTPTEPVRFPLVIPELTPSKTQQQTFPDTITIKAVGAKVLNVKKNPIKITQNMVILGEGLKYISLIV
ncbi:MAG: hypothetical protein V7K22_12490, partial [Nostoc sp.]